MLYEHRWPLGRDDQERHGQQQVQFCTRLSMSRSNKDGLELQSLAKELLDDPIGKANHIVTLLKAVHTSKPKVSPSLHGAAVPFFDSSTHTAPQSSSRKSTKLR